MIMDKAIKELASREYNELCSLVRNITYFEAYNKLNGYNLTSEPITIGKENKLIGMNEFFDVKYKHIQTTIFRVKDNRCEVWEEFFLEFRMCATFDNDVNYVDEQ